MLAGSLPSGSMTTTTSPSRLDIFLAKQHQPLSRAFFQKFIKTLGVVVNGKLVKKPNFQIHDTDAIALSEKTLQAFFTSQQNQEEPSPALTKAILLYEGKKILVIDKMPGIRTEHLAKGFFPAHRLDKDTSGVLVLARDTVTLAELQSQWKERRVSKMYEALLVGKLSPKKGAIDGGILRSFKDRTKMAVSEGFKSRTAYTEYEVVTYFELPGLPALPGGVTLVRAFPKTGRTHQIRVHFASIGHPVAGDRVYGEKEVNEALEEACGLKRQFLHAAQLIFTNPETRKKLRVRSPLPDDLKRALATITH